MNTLSPPLFAPPVGSTAATVLLPNCLHCKHWDRILELDNGHSGECQAPLIPSHITKNTHSCIEFQPLSRNDLSLRKMSQLT